MLDALAGGLAALGVLLLDAPSSAAACTASSSRLLQVGELARRGVDVDVGGDVGALAGLCAHWAVWRSTRALTCWPRWIARPI